MCRSLSLSLSPSCIFCFTFLLHDFCHIFHGARSSCCPFPPLPLSQAPSRLQLLLWRHCDVVVVLTASLSSVFCPQSSLLCCMLYVVWQIIINFPLAMTTNIFVWHVWKYLLFGLPIYAGNIFWLIDLHAHRYICILSWVWGKGNNLTVFDINKYM